MGTTKDPLQQGPIAHHERIEASLLLGNCQQSILGAISSICWLQRLLCFHHPTPHLSDPALVCCLESPPLVSSFSLIRRHTHCVVLSPIFLFLVFVFHRQHLVGGRRQKLARPPIGLNGRDGTLREPMSLQNGQEAEGASLLHTRVALGARSGRVERDKTTAA